MSAPSLTPRVACSPIRLLAVRTKLLEAFMRNLGILWVLYGLLRLLGALGIFFYSGTLTLMWGALLTRVPNPFSLMDLFHGFLLFAILLGIVAGVVSILAGLNLISSGISARSL